MEKPSSPTSLPLPSSPSRSSAPKRSFWRPTLLLLAIMSYLLWSGVSKVGVPEFTDDSGVSNSGGYSLSKVEHTSNGLTARLTLAGEPVNLYGSDIKDLILEVEYQSDTRLHVHISDSAKTQFQIPEHILPRPTTKGHSKPELEFHHTPSPFAFWITRRSDSAVLFDTRPASLPGSSPSDLIFSDQYLQLTTALPHDANIYGLGEVASSAGIRNDPANTTITLWNRDSGGTPVDENLYGSHPFYIDLREGASHGVFMRNSHGMDVVLKDGYLSYKMLGGTMDLYVLSGPTPVQVVEQYSDVVGRPGLIPFWAFGFHLCRWGYETVEVTKGAVEKMREAGIPLETIWNDLDYMDKRRNFVLDANYASKEDFKAFTDWLHHHHQHYIPLVDAAIARTNETGDYPVYDEGTQMDVFMKEEDGENEFVGKVWPGETVFPDWTAPGVAKWWKDSFDSFKEVCDYDGIWLDMNEPSSFSSGYGGKDPEEDTLLQSKRREVVWAKNKYDEPKYSIKDGYGGIDRKTAPPSCMLSDGTRMYNQHNLFGYQENIMTHDVLLKQHPGKRPFIISRSTFAGHGRVSNHWLGDNYSTWKSMRFSISGVLQFQMFQIPMTGPDACGFGGDSNEELCNRWMMLSAFYPFYRNHNAIDQQDQEPYTWDSVAQASKKYIAMRYQLLPYWETLFARAHHRGTPPLRPLIFEYAHPSLAKNDEQFLLGHDLLVTPVLHKGKTEVTGSFPSEGGVTWRDWYTHELVHPDESGRATLAAPLGHLPVHIRSGAIILTYKQPEYTLTETRPGEYGLIIHLDGNGQAQGEAVLDDGISIEPEMTTVSFAAAENRLSLASVGTYAPLQQITELTILGLRSEPESVSAQGGEARMEWSGDVGTLRVRGVRLDLAKGEVRW